jgi:pimeloyl-ACP methyl ester carboxylesterase
MPDRLPIGPYRTVQLADKVAAPWYVVPFDLHGRCEAPLTRDYLLDDLQNGDYTDVFLFSHGWNNDWTTATNRYEDFFQGYVQLRRDRDLQYPRLVHPLFVGVFWPSTALVLPQERGPAFAGIPSERPKQEDFEIAQEREEVQSLAQSIAAQDLENFYTLAQRPENITRDEALELARILRPIYRTSYDDLSSVDSAPTAEDLVDVWSATGRPDDEVDTSGEFGFAEGTGGTLDAASLLNVIDPRRIIRLVTVLQMKDRAGTVGAHGVNELLCQLLAKKSTVRLHLIGHSYGCKIVLSALCARDLPRSVNSLLLLQPAISYLCFAQDATGDGKPGGYRIALSRVEQPVLSTFSTQDEALRRFFHLAVRRKIDLGEMRIAGVPPSRYAALGGYGPGGCESDCRETAMKVVGEHYPLGGDVPKIYGVNGSQAILSHGDISNPFTWWALYDQVAR